MAADFPRRGVLQGGALASTLVALRGLRPQPAAAHPDRGRPIAGSIAAHIQLNLAKGATIRLTELDPDARPTRDLVIMHMPLTMIYPGGTPRAGGGPVRIVCEQAQTLAIRVAAASWHVPSAECGLSGSRIIHDPSGRALPYRAWVDIT